MTGWLAWIGLGSNLGDREAHLRLAVDRLAENKDISIEDCSPVYECEAMLAKPNSPDQPAFLNAVIRIRTYLSPLSLLDVLHSVELMSGRTRDSTRWAARQLDLDILLYEDLSVTTDRLIVPHPGIPSRRFVLQPLYDLDPSLRIPEPVSLAVDEALSECRDEAVLVRTDVALC
ncbi:MAG: 2-amino-4-hydroxy-6-hydroxymethyldihydropteridine diphosphokinase [Rhodothermales bacterium]|nr:2-amino-4-hydroxy-6-hydroxymethyldihydropteridine diphosphokinase [Rhodothermales bacterium]